MDVKRYIESRGFTQVSLAERLGLHKNTINRWVRLSRAPRWLVRWMEYRNSMGREAFDTLQIIKQRMVAAEAKILERQIKEAKVLDRKRRLKWKVRTAK